MPSYAAQELQLEVLDRTGRGQQAGPMASARASLRTVALWRYITGCRLSIGSSRTLISMRPGQNQKDEIMESM